ncbi:SusC/RagA family TonB-linked outer membrane protein, partial [Bacteroides cellulosilyticus]
MIVFSSSAVLYAQGGGKVRVKGHVSDVNQELLIGVSIQEKGTSNGIITDVNGGFSLEVSPKATLVVSYVGYATQEFPIKNQTDFDIVLQEDAQLLNEVVVVGYGTQKKGNLTGAIASIKSDEILTTTHSSLAQNLQGKVAGLQIRQQSGEPGSFDNMISIRGFGTPLYVIDGIPRDGSGEFQRLNPTDIESISILKDASAAIYGLNAANGVILVTTKKGQKGKPRFNYSGVFGWQKPTDVPEMMNAGQFMDIKNEASINAGGEPILTKEELMKWKEGAPGYESTDWYDEAMKGSAFQQQHNFSVTGGSENVDFFFSLGYLTDNGIVKNDGFDYEKYTFRSNLSAKLSKHLTAEVLIGGRYDTKKTPRFTFFDIFKATRAAWPTERPFANNNPDYPSKVFLDNNPVAMSDPDIVGYSQTNNKALQTTASVKYDVPFVQGLQIKATGAYDSNMYMGKNAHRSYDVFTYASETDTYLKQTIGAPAYINNSYDDHNKLVLQAQVSYQRLFNKRHNVGVTLVYEQSKYWYRNSSLHRDYDFYTNDQVDQGSVNNMKNGGYETEEASMSYIGRFTYDYMSRYLVEFAFREDGSYRYAPGARWGFFPVVSVGYRISEEKFIKDNLTFIDNLKLRASYGTVGENTGEPFQYVQGFSTTGGGGYSFVDGVYTGGAASPGIINPNLTWLKSKTLNIGIDVGLFKGLLNFEMDLYQRDRKGLLAKRNLSLPNTFGGSLPDENINSDRVRGIDLSVSHNNSIGSFHYGVKFNMNFARTMNRYVERAPFRSSMEKWRNGSSNRWNDMSWGFVPVGQFQDMDDVNSYILQNGDQGNIQELPGSFKYEDVNGDGLLDDNDLQPLFWTGQPKMHYGITLNASYKGFDFNALLQGSGKYSVRFTEIYSEIMALNG